MLIDGEKYACDACVRGHRVSNCQHADRPLQHIAKKGRPVSQCQHCRGLRKARSTHAKCDCGEKIHSKGACKHGKDGDATSKSEGCGGCCSHGGRCACGLKKEPHHLDPVPESDSDEGCSSSAPSSIIQARPRAHTTQSEGTGLTVFTNGHHKPAHKHNQAAHKCGMPYVVPRAHSIHGTTPGNMANRSVDSLPHVGSIDTLHASSVVKDSMVSAQQDQRQVKSEHNSPNASVTNLGQLNGSLTALDMPNFEAFQDYGFPLCYDPLSADVDQPIFSAGLSAGSVDWSHYDGLDFNSNVNDNFTTSEFGQAPSFVGYDFSSVDQPALTSTTTSGEISEAEDFSFSDNRNSRPGVSTYPSDISDFGEVDTYRLSTASSYLGMPQTQMLASGDNGTLDIDDFLKGVTTNNGYVQANTSQTGTSMPATTSFTDHTKYVQTNSPFEDNAFSMPTMEEDEGLWMNTYDGNNGSSVSPITYNGNAVSTISNSNGDISDFDSHNIWAQ